MKGIALALCLVITSSCDAAAKTFDPHDPRSPLRLIRTIQLPNVSGRIDHMALDPERRHLYIAEYENGTVDEVDLKSAKVVGRITDLKRPQGVAWLAAQGELAVASEGGRVTFYRASDRREVAIVDLGDDADNVRIDRRNGHLLVGYGTGAIAIIDPTTHRVIGSVQLPAHPEAFEISASSVFVNVPDAHSLVIADQDHNRVISKNSTGLRFGNFPMVSDDTGHHIAIAFRKPPTVALLDVPWGDILWTSPVCGDADDLFFHASKIVVVCGSGAVDLLSAWSQLDHVRVITQKGARTGLIDPAVGNLLIAVPGRTAGAIWELAFR